MSKINVVACNYLDLDEIRYDFEIEIQNPPPKNIKYPCRVVFTLSLDEVTQFIEDIKSEVIRETNEVTRFSEWES